ncbi:unnamed protein product [Blepharisma stoltei]|uniref:Endonuclease/exonuclease/phosphatase domain-containing protein n=1 Tax=Blepharisma stoltei TaxID=1481888 RepID=A0AAU9JLA0_9CILI|nr:unnamed protein product [Blepharisma stoltei]
MLLGRSLLQVKPIQPIFTVMTWNTLSDQLSGFFPLVADEYLAWNHRSQRILHELDSIGADLYCLSEIDHYDDFIVPWMNEKGFAGIYQKKRGWHRDGICLLYNKKFSVSSQEAWYFPNSNQFALVVKLNFASIEFIVVATHLKSMHECEEERAIQMEYLLQKLDLCAGNLPLIMCGDFNTEPGSKTYNILSEHRLSFKSVYNKEGIEPIFTTFKFRDEFERKTVDYIWIKGFDVACVLSMPSEETIGEKGLPSQIYPSDHLSLACQLNLQINPSL